MSYLLHTTGRGRCDAGQARQMLRFETVRGLLSIALPPVVAFGFALACGAAETRRMQPLPRSSPASRAPASSTPASNPTAPPPAIAAASDPLLLVTDPIALAALDQ